MIFKAVQNTSFGAVVHGTADAPPLVSILRDFYIKWPDGTYNFVEKAEYWPQVGNEETGIISPAYIILPEPLTADRMDGRERHAHEQRRIWDQCEWISNNLKSRFNVPHLTKHVVYSSLYKLLKEEGWLSGAINGSNAFFEWIQNRREWRRIVNVSDKMRRQQEIKDLAAKAVYSTPKWTPRSVIFDEVSVGKSAPQLASMANWFVRQVGDPELALKIMEKACELHRVSSRVPGSVRDSRSCEDATGDGCPQG